MLSLSPCRFLSLGWTADEQDRRTQILKKLCGRIDEENPPYIEPPFSLDYVSTFIPGSKVAGGRQK